MQAVPLDTQVKQAKKASLESGDTETAPPKEITPKTLKALDPATGWWGHRGRAMEEWISRLSIRSNFWHRIVVWIFLPLAYRSGIMLGRWNGDVYEARMPFRSFNKNWYGVMAGSALLANSEVAGGMCLFEAVGADYTLVCKEMRYKFRLPCRGPAIYRVRVNGNVEELRRTRLEFNVDVELEIVQAAGREGGKERCVGRCSATFHVAPKALFRARCAKEKESARTLANRGRQD